VLGIWVVCRRDSGNGGGGGGGEVPSFLGAGIVALCSIGILAEAIDKHGSQSDSPFEHIGKEHVTMYAGFLVAGLGALLESKGRLVAGTWRLGLAVALGVEAFLFNGHAAMQHSMEHSETESTLHAYLALMCGLGALCFAGSVVDSGRWVAWTSAGCGLLLAQAFFFYFLAWALYSGAYGHMAADMDMPAAMAYASMTVLSAGCLAAAVHARWLARDDAAAAVKYSALAEDASHGDKP